MQVRPSLLRINLSPSDLLDEFKADYRSGRLAIRAITFEHLNPNAKALVLAGVRAGRTAVIWSLDMQKYRAIGEPKIE